MFDAEWADPDELAATSHQSNSGAQRAVANADDPAANVDDPAANVDDPAAKEPAPSPATPKVAGFLTNSDTTIDL